MRMVSAAALTLIALCAGPAEAEDLKAFKLTIDGVTVDIDPGESTDVTLPGGKKSKVTLERNDFATFSGGNFSFVHPSDISVTKTDLGEDITQYLMASALGTIVVVQEYGEDEPGVAQPADAAGDDQGVGAGRRDADAGADDAQARRRQGTDRHPRHGEDTHRHRRFRDRRLRALPIRGCC